MAAGDFRFLTSPGQDAVNGAAAGPAWGDALRIAPPRRSIAAEFADRPTPLLFEAGDPRGEWASCDLTSGEPDRPASKTPYQGPHRADAEDFHPTPHPSPGPGGGPHRSDRSTLRARDTRTSAPPASTPGPPHSSGHTVPEPTPRQGPVVRRPLRHRVVLAETGFCSTNAARPPRSAARSPRGPRRDFRQIASRDPLLTAVRGDQRGRIRTALVFSAPFGPGSQKTVPRGTSQIDPIED